MTSSAEQSPVHGVRKWGLLAGGWLAVGLGAIGVVVPGLPTTVFFIIAAWCFARCSPRFEQWVLELPRVGSLVRDHRDGLGMPRRAKVAAVTTMVLVGLTSVALLRDRPGVALGVAIVLAVGIGWVSFRVPTREAVLDHRH